MSQATGDRVGTRPVPGAIGRRSRCVCLACLCVVGALLAVLTFISLILIEPESDRKPGRISYTVTVTHDYPVGYWFWIAAGLLVVPAILITWRSINFEHRRWQESDHASHSGVASALSSISSGGDE